MANYHDAKTIPEKIAHLREWGCGGCKLAADDWEHDRKALLARLGQLERAQDWTTGTRQRRCAELQLALDEWLSAGAPTEAVVKAMANLVQNGIDFVIAEFDDDSAHREPDKHA